MNKEVSRPLQAAVWGGLFLVIVVIGGAFLLSRQGGTRTAKGPSADAQALPVYGALPEFTLTNQLGKTVTRDALRNRVSVIDIIFSRCPGPCAELSRRMSELQETFKNEPQVQLISLTTDPEYDRPEVLQKYGARFGALAERWMFLTGDPGQVQNLITNGLKMTMLEKKPEERSVETDLFIHSTLFILVDRQGRMRQTVHALEPDYRDKSVAAVGALLKERAP